MSSGRIHIGASGWNYAHWQGVFYPADMRQADWLAYYARHLHTVEINNSFYNLPELSTIKNWYGKVPKRFTFAVKASRYISHMKKLKDVRRPMYSMMRRIGALQDKLGPVLVQLPPGWKCNEERLEKFLKHLYQDQRFAIEFRNDSWWNDTVYGLLEKHHAAFCIFELARVRTPNKVTSEFVYIRLHGPGGAYQGCYSADDLSGWAGAIASWARDGKDVYCYFDNDDSGYAVQNALELQEMLS
jgi:uncharacterized protein YecE (DUF72 family)